jgi:hypothetical protein
LPRGVVGRASTAPRSLTRSTDVSAPRGDSACSGALARVSRYDIRHVEIYRSARRHGIADEDIVHAVEQAVAVGEQDDGKVLYLGPDRAANLLEVVSVVREDGSEIVIHAMRMRGKYEPFLRGEGDSDA